MSWCYCPFCGKKLRFEQLRDGEPLWQVCNGCGRIYYRNAKPSVSAIIFRDSRVLLMKRSREPMKGWWDLPGGFHEADEHPLQGVIRECSEEVGLTIEPIRLLGVYMGYYDNKGDRDSILNIVYVAQVSEEKIKDFTADETEAVKWFALDELPEHLAFEHNNNALRDWRLQDQIDQ